MILVFIYNIHGDKLASQNQRWLQQDLRSLINSVDNLCTPQNFWGFIDGTLRPISRPSFYQEHAYTCKLTIFKIESLNQH